MKRNILFHSKNGKKLYEKKCIKTGNHDNNFIKTAVCCSTNCVPWSMAVKKKKEINKIKVDCGSENQISMFYIIIS